MKDKMNHYVKEYAAQSVRTIKITTNFFLVDFNITGRNANTPRVEKNL